MKEYLKKLGWDRESHFYHNILQKEYENIIWCKNYKKFFDYSLKIDFIGVKKNEWNGITEINFIQIGSANKIWKNCLRQFKFNIKENKNYKIFIYNFLYKNKIIQFDEKYTIYYRFYVLFKNWKTNEELLIKDYKIIVKKISLNKKK